MKLRQERWGQANMNFVKPELMRLINDPLKSEVFEDWTSVFKKHIC
jgi:hypothetical protein